MTSKLFIKKLDNFDKKRQDMSKNKNEIQTQTEIVENFQKL